MPPAATKKTITEPTQEVEVEQVAAGGLTEAEEKLLAELTARSKKGTSERVARDLTAREQILSSELRDRNHLDGCPAIDDREKYATLVEGYTATKPADPRVGRGPQDVVVIRCIECGGSRIDEDHTTTDGLIMARLRERQGIAAPAVDLDVSL